MKRMLTAYPSATESCSPSLHVGQARHSLAKTQTRVVENRIWSQIFFIASVYPPATSNQRSFQRIRVMAMFARKKCRAWTELANTNFNFCDHSLEPLRSVKNENLSPEHLRTEVSDPRLIIRLQHQVTNRSSDSNVEPNRINQFRPLSVPLKLIGVSPNPG